MLQVLHLVSYRAIFSKVEVQQQLQQLWLVSTVCVGTGANELLVVDGEYPMQELVLDGSAVGNSLWLKWDSCVELL